jgi:hypothetical protein
MCGPSFHNFSKLFSDSFTLLSTMCPASFAYSPATAGLELERSTKRARSTESEPVTVTASTPSFDLAQLFETVVPEEDSFPSISWYSAFGSDFEPHVTTIDASSAWRIGAKRSRTFGRVRSKPLETVLGEHNCTNNSVDTLDSIHVPPLK